MKILLFEFATAKGIHDPSIYAEGRAMLQGLAQDLENLSTDYLISGEVEPFDSGSSSPITIHCDPGKWIKNNIHNYDYCLPIAPEEHFILYHYICLIENSGVKVLGSDSDSVLICTDKFLTHQVLQNRVPLIPTWRVYWDQAENYPENLITDRMVVKPADGVSCSAVQIIDSTEELSRASHKIKEVSRLPYFLLQEYVPGESASVSLLTDGDRAMPISLNKQKVEEVDGNMVYKGGDVPFNHPLKERAEYVARRAVESIPGLRGYIGVDLIISEEEIYLVEINSRITTPYVALRNMLNFNLGEAILESVQGKLPSNLEVNGEATFWKEDDKLHQK